MKEQLFTQRGGARRGSANYTWLFERLTILKDGLILSGTKIPKENIEKLEAISKPKHCAPKSLRPQYIVYSIC